MQIFCFSILASLASLTPYSVAAPAKTEKFQVNSAPFKLDFNVLRLNSSALSGFHKHKPNWSNRKTSSSVHNDGGLNLVLQNEYALYLTDLEVGTPGQKLQVNIDTGSSDLWLPAEGTYSDSGTFRNNASSSYEKIKSGFKISYGDGTFAYGDWATDSITIGGSEVKNVTFGYATQQSANQAILGVGFRDNEASAYQDSNAFTYDNFPIQLKQQGIINKVAYSLYLNSLEAQAGSILFGAIDHAKFDGELKTLDVVDIDNYGEKTDKPIAFFVNLDGITQSNGTTNNVANQSYPALLDSGTTLIYAPQTIAREIGLKYGKFSVSAGGYLVDCDTKGNDFVFKFEGVSITVPFNYLLFHTNGEANQQFSNQCLFGVLPSPSNIYILGDAFLRSAYVYYDLEDGKVGIAQAKYTNETDIEVIDV